MSLSLGMMSKHIDGHKELTAHNAILKLKEPDNIAIALSRGNAKIQCLVEVGQHVKIGDLIAKEDDFFYVPFFSSISGTVVAIEKRPGINLKPVDHIIIESDQKEEVAELNGISFDASKEEVIAFIKEKGIIGCGGAGFPTYFKYDTDKCETLIINCVECEPYITSDARMIEENISDLLNGTKTLFRISGAKRCLLAIKENKKEIIELLHSAFDKEENIEIVTLKDLYPMGWERTLVYETVKKRYDRLPIEVGIIISNATTVIMAAKAMRTGLPIIEKMITVSGDGIKQPHNVIAKVGTSFKELAECCGGYQDDDIYLIAGGPMMGSSLNSDKISVNPACNAFTILKAHNYNSSPCLRCGSCIEHCPSGLQPVNIMNALKASNFDLLNKLHALDCVECGLCSYVCPSKINVTDEVRKAKKILAIKRK